MSERWKRCPYCGGRGKVRMNDPQVRQRILRTLRWLRHNVRNGSVIVIGGNPRKVLAVNKNNGTLTLRKINFGGRFPNNPQTVYVIYDYYRKLGGKLK